MKELVRNVRGSFLPSSARKELFSFLSSIPALRQELIWVITLQHVKKLHEATGNTSEPDEQEIKGYIFHHHGRLEEEYNKILKNLVRQALPGFNWLAIFKNIGLFAIFYVPAVYYLLSDIINKWNTTGTIDSGEAIALLFLILFLLIVGGGIIIAAFLNKSHDQ